MARLVPARWCCGYASDRVTIRVVMICMIQGLLWSSFAVFLLAVQTCALQFESIKNSTNIRDANNKFVYIVNLISVAYLTGSNCSRQDEVLVSNSTTQRTYNLLLIHGFLNAVWIPICVLLIVGVLNKVRGCLAVALIYFPWILVTLAVVALDLVAASYYISDMNHAGSLNSFLSFLRFSTSTDRLLPGSSPWDGFTFYAPLVFVLYFSRCVLLSLFNVCACVHVLCLMVRLFRERRFAPANGLLPDSYDEIYSPIINTEVESIPLHAFVSSGFRASNRYKPELSYYNGMVVSSNSVAGMRHFYQNREPSVHTYLDLLSYQTPVYQHIYEDIWRDLKKERLSYGSKTERSYYNAAIPVTPITPVSPVYDYLGRPVLEYKVTNELSGYGEEIKGPSRLIPGEHGVPSRSSIPFVRSSIPPALPPCNATKKLKNPSKIAEPVSEDYESLTPFYEQAKFSYKSSDKLFEIPEDNVQDLYSRIRKDTAGIENASFQENCDTCIQKHPGIIKKRSLDECYDSAYNSGSSVSNYRGSSKRLSFEDCNDSAYNSGSNVTNCSRGVQTCSDYACIERANNITNSETNASNNSCRDRSSSEAKTSDSENDSNSSFKDSNDSNKSSFKSSNINGTEPSIENIKKSSCTNMKNSQLPEPPDLPQSPMPHNEQRKNKRNLPPLIIKPLPPKIEITPSGQDQKMKARM